ncbi:MAG: O-antigen ligase family protein [Candidatus Saccharibacteria bacterium]|nr:O-antigen ligase family protein [Candidatus Saccharibacteria bacterium]
MFNTEKIKKIPYYGALALLIYMPFHVFLSQWLSTFTGGLNGWKVAKDVFIMLAVWVSFALVIYTKKYKNTPYLSFTLLAFSYLALHMLLYFAFGNTDQGVASLGTVYNNRLTWLFIIGFSAALLTPKLVTPRKLGEVLLGVSTIVCLLGVAQFVLPSDVMTTFGYGKDRGTKASFAIDDKPDLPRAFSTIRDPNSLGAFLIIPITLIWSVLFKKEHEQKRLLLSGLLMLHGLVLFLTFSRAAWIGVAISVLVASWLHYKSWIKQHRRSIIAAMLVLAVGLFSFGYAFRDQYFVQNVIYHSDENTEADLDSNALHYELAEGGLREFSENPVGDGPGTAGIVSIQNDGKGLLTENYYIQILHEVGVIGLAIFVGFFGYIIYALKKSKSALGLTLFATGIAYAVMCLVMHLFTNEAVTTQWWLLAGTILALSATPSKPKRKNH